MTENKTRRNFLIGSVTVPGSIAATVALQQNKSDAATPETEVVEKSIDADRLSRFQKEVQEKAIETLDLSPLFMMLDKYGFPERTVKVEVKIMLNKMREHMNNGVKQQKSIMTDPELENSLMAVYAGEIMVQDCWLCPNGLSCN